MDIKVVKKNYALQQKPIVLGIDVGIAITGWSIVEREVNSINKNKLIDYGAIITDSKITTGNRLVEIYKSLKKIIKKYKPNSMSIESIFYFKNQKTIINVSQARGVMLLVASEANMPIYEYTPLQVKAAVTGYGKAEKEQVQKMVKLIYNLDKIPEPDDVADAIAVGTCHINTFY